eukprot:7642_1
MDLIHIILQVINPFQIQSLCKDIRLGLFSLFPTKDIASKLPKYIQVSLGFPHCIQLSFWTLLYIHTLKHLAELKRSYLDNDDDNPNYNVWITSTAIDGLLDWTHRVSQSKRMDDIYNVLLAFPTEACNVNYVFMGHNLFR